VAEFFIDNIPAEIAEWRRKKTVFICESLRFLRANSFAEGKY